MITITKRAAEEINLSTHDPDSQGCLSALQWIKLMKVFNT